MVASSGSSSARFHGNDRFYSPPALRRLNEQQQQSQKLQNQQQQPPMQRPARSKPRSSPPAASAPSESLEVAVSRAQPDESSSKPSVPALPASPQPMLAPTAGNLDRLLAEITPVVPAQYSSKVRWNTRKEFHFLSSAIVLLMLCRSHLLSCPRQA